jgi:two-component system, sensor histidine kinase
MTAALMPPDEAERLAALLAYDVLDSSPEQPFDDLVRLAATLCGTPIAAVSLVDADRQWFKASVGLDVSETPRQISFCAHAMLDADRVMEVPDATRDERFADNPLVTGDFHLRLYAGAPLVSPAGAALGALCVIDRVARPLTPEQRDGLAILAREVVARLELRRDLVLLRRKIERDAEEHRRAEVARQAVEAAARVRSEFLAVMSHELRTPMNAIMGFTQLLARDITEPGQQARLQRIGTAANHLLAMIDNILDYARIDDGRGPVLAEASFNVPDCVEDAVETALPRAAGKSLEVLCDIDPGVQPFLRGDAVRLRQVLLLLLDNAIKFTIGGEVSVRVAPAGPGALGFEVSDTGIGIAPESLGCVFEPFFQVDASLSRRFEGMGMGLAICKRIVEAMGGEIRVSSTLGKGSAFSVTLPTPAGEGELPESFRRHAAALAGKRALIVDDHVGSLRVLSRQCSAWGMKVCAEADPLQALQRLERGECFDVALLDAEMPGLDGRALAKAIRCTGLEGHMALLLASRTGLRASDAPSHPFTAELCKPARRADLARALFLGVSHRALQPQDP